MSASKNASTLAIIIFACFQLLSFGIFPFVAINTITAAVQFVTAPGGDPNDFSSVKLFLFNVFNASCAARSAGSAFTKSSSQSVYENNSETKKNVLKNVQNFCDRMSGHVKKKRNKNVNIKKPFCFFDTSSAIMPTFSSSSSAMAFSACKKKQNMV